MNTRMKFPSRARTLYIWLGVQEFRSSGVTSEPLNSAKLMANKYMAKIAVYSLINRVALFPDWSKYIPDGKF